MDCQPKYVSAGISDESQVITKFGLRVTRNDIQYDDWDDHA